MLHGLKLGRNYGTYGSRINRPVSMPSRLPIHRTYVQAGTAADAMQGLLGLSIGKDVSPAVIEQNDVKSRGPEPGVTPVQIEL